MTSDSSRIRSTQARRRFRLVPRERILWYVFSLLLLFSLWLIIADIANTHIVWEWDGHAQQGGVMAASSIAALGVLSGIKTWTDEIRSKKYDAEQAAYAKLVEHLMGQFAIDEPVKDLAAMRADVVLCASQSVVEKLAQYNADVHRAKNEGRPRGTAYGLTTEGRVLLRQRIAEMVATIRSESGFAHTDLKIIESALFDRDSTEE